MSPIKLSGKRPPAPTNPLSHEQQQILQAVVENNQNVIVNAVAGSGKTTTILALIKALQIKRQSQGLPTNFLVLMFNKELQKESETKAVKQKIMSRPKSMKTNPFRTFHSVVNLIQDWLINAGFVNGNQWLPPELTNDPDWKALQQAWNFKQQNNPNTADGTGVSEFLDALWTLLQKSETFCNRFFIYNQAIPNYDLICFDESQDLYGNVSWKIVQLLVAIALKRQQILKVPLTRFLFVGDENQAIYNYQGADPRFITLAPFLLEELKLIHLPLSTSYRITKPMAAVASQLIKPKLTIMSAKTQTDASPVKLTLCPNVENNFTNHQTVVKMIVDEIVLKVQSGIPANEILVLTRGNVGDKDETQGARKMFKLVEAIRSGLYQQQIVCEDLNKYTRTNKVQMLTMHKAKGLEAQHVIVLGLTNDEILKFEDYDFVGYQESAPNLHYVAFTRAKQSLSIYIVPFVALKHSPLPAYLINQANVILELQNEGLLQWNNLSGMTDDFVFFKRAPFYQNPAKLKLVIEPSKIDDLPKAIWEEINTLKISESQDDLGTIQLPRTIQGKLFSTNQADVADLKTTLGSLITFMTLKLMQNEAQVPEVTPEKQYHYPSNHIHQSVQPCLRPLIDQTFAVFWALIERIYIRQRVANLDPLIDFFENGALMNVLKQRIQNLQVTTDQISPVAIDQIYEGELLAPLNIAFATFLKPHNNGGDGWRTLAEWKALTKLPATTYPKLHDFWQTLIDHFGEDTLLEWQKMTGIFDFYTLDHLVEIKTGNNTNLQKAQIQLILYAYFLQLNNELCQNNFEEKVKQQVKDRHLEQYTINAIDEVLAQPPFLVAINLTTGEQIKLQNDPPIISAIAKKIIINELVKALKLSDQEFVDRYRLIV